MRDAIEVWFYLFLFIGILESFSSAQRLGPRSTEQKVRGTRRVLLTDVGGGQSLDNAKVIVMGMMSANPISNAISVTLWKVFQVVQDRGRKPATTASIRSIGCPQGLRAWCSLGMEVAQQSLTP